MSRAFKRNYLQHALAVRRWMEATGAEGGIDPFSYAMDIRCKGRTARLHGQFVTEDESGSLRFVRELGVGVSGFAGWLPYTGKAWPIAQDKWEFKAFAAEADLKVPAWTTDASTVKGTYIVKARRSTFGRGMRGPFSVGHDPRLVAGEYCEQFIAGQLIKAWFWNAEPAVVEIVDMPRVSGDGLRTLRQLISAKLAPTDRWPSDLDCLAAVQGTSLEAVIPRGKSVVADYRYMSVLNPSINIDYNVREQIRGSSLESQLRDAGAKCWAVIPESIRQDTIFSLDGVVDAQGQVWFLEANCNPLLHPAIYQNVLTGLFLQ